MLQGMTKETARRYIKVMDEINDIAWKFQGFVYLMTSYLDKHEGGIEINPSELSDILKRLADDVLQITTLLDKDFICKEELEIELEALENEK